MPNRRSSTIIVQEVLGTPFRVFSALLGISMAAAGLRCIFACDTALPGEGELMKETLARLWPECRTDKYQELAAGTAGIFALCQALVRYQIVTCQHVADMANTLTVLVFQNALLVMIQMRMAG